MFDPRPIYYSSLTTAVGGTYDINFVDSGSPCCGTNHILRGVFGSREREKKGKKMGEKEAAGKLPPTVSVLPK